MLKNKNIVLIILFLVIFSSFQVPKKRLFVIGDSISIFYGPSLSEIVKVGYIYDRLKDSIDTTKNMDIPTGANGGNSKMVIDHLNNLIKKGLKVDVLLINCGLHDIKTDRISGKKAISEVEYKENIDSIITLSALVSKEIIWISSTPVNDTIHNSKNVGFYRYNNDVISYNRIASEELSAKKIRIIDLYSYSLSFPYTAYMDHVHYLPAYSKLQAEYIASFLNR